MALDRNQIYTLIDMVSSAESDETDCGTCYDHLAEFAEAELMGKEITEALDATRRHLEQCACCNMEYEVLLEGIRSLED